MAEIDAQFQQRFDQSLRAGLTALVRAASEQYRSDVTQVTEEPTDDLRFEGPHSQPGEYPHKETGQGEANITFAVDRVDGELVGRFGVMGEESGFGPFAGHSVPGGQHLVHLSHGRHPVTGEFFGRLGMDRTIPDNVEAMRQAFIEGIRNAQ